MEEPRSQVGGPLHQRSAGAFSTISSTYLGDEVDGHPFLVVPPVVERHDASVVEGLQDSDLGEQALLVLLHVNSADRHLQGNISSRIWSPSNKVAVCVGGRLRKAANDISIYRT